jgi:hypothetical protein
MNKISKYKIEKKNQLLKALKAKQIIIKIMRIKLIQIQIEHDIFNF